MNTAESEAAARNEYLRRKYGRLRSYMLWRPSDIDMATADEFWVDIKSETDDTWDTTTSSGTTGRCIVYGNSGNIPVGGTFGDA